jgi:metallo-beta-lactamase family protein
VEAIAPYSSDEYELLTAQCTAKCRIVKLTKQSDGRRRANAIYEKLLSAGKRLLHIIEQSKGLTNKELAKFTDQINALCDKYSKK